MLLEWVMARWAKLVAWVYVGMSNEEQKQLKPEMKEVLDWCRDEKLPEAAVEIRQALDDIPD